MFERYIAEALASNFGQFIENCNADNIKISVWNGHVILKDLKLKHDALNHLLKSGNNRSKSNNNSGEGESGNYAVDDENNHDEDDHDEDDNHDFPCQISYGHIGTFELHIPWTLLRSAQLGSGTDDNTNTNDDDSSSSNSRSSKWTNRIRWSGTSEKRNNSETTKNTSQEPKSSNCSITLSDVSILIHPGRRKKNKKYKSTKETKVSDDSNNDNESNMNDEERQQILHQHRIQKERQVQHILDEALFRKNINLSTLSSPTIIDNSEDDNNSSNNNNNNNKSTSTDNKSHFLHNLFKNIISSLSITVRNIHIRYEDPGDCLGFDTNNIIHSTTSSSANTAGRSAVNPNQFPYEKNSTPTSHPNKRQRLRYRPPFAIGVTLKQFSVHSTKNGPLHDDKLYKVPDIIMNDQQSSSKKEEMEDQDDSDSALYSVQHKLAAATNLSIYWDSDIAMNELIHISVKRRMRYKRRKERLNRKLFVNHENNESIDELDPKLPLSSNDGDVLNIHTSLNIANVESLEDEEDDENVYDENNEENVSNSLYSKMLNDAIDMSNGNKVHTALHRTYIIEPVSPSLHFTIVSVLPQAQNYVGFVPPSRAVLSVSALQSNLSKDTMEDIAYLRRSFKIWKEMKNSLLSRKVYTQLMNLRPLVSPKQDPKRWWRYAFEAVKLLAKVRNDDSNDSSRFVSKRKKKGWLGLSNSLKLKRKYVSLYEQLLNPNLREDIKADLSYELSLMEDFLDIQEIVAFRISMLAKENNCHARGIKNGHNLKNESPNDNANWSSWKMPWSQMLSEHKTDDNITNNTNYSLFTDNEMLTWKQRERVYYEMTEAMAVGDAPSEKVLFSDSFHHLGSNTGSQLLQERSASSGYKLEVSIICPQVILQADDVIAANSMQTKIRQRLPIIQLTFASVQKLRLRRDSSWDILCTLASLEVINLMNKNQSSSSLTVSQLLTRKRKLASLSMDSSFIKSVRFGDTNHFHSATVYLQKRVLQKIRDEHDFSNNNDSAMTINIHVSPMEATYSPEPVHAFTQLFSTAQTLELLSDYQRLKSLLSTWRAKQKQRLIEVLSQQEKKLLVNVDVAAPVFFMHDEVSNGTLMLDLGRLIFRNSDTEDNSKHGYDGWRLLLTDIQALSLPRPEYIGVPEDQLVRHETYCHLIEPFSLDFKIHTKFGIDKWNGVSSDLNSEILINATLPRLVFNLTSSSVRLVHRITEKRKIVRARRLASAKIMNQAQSSRNNKNGPLQKNIVRENHEYNRNLVKFEFSAPLIALSLTNDIDGRDCGPSSNTQIAELVMQGIGGKLSHMSSSAEQKELNFDACLKSLHAKDFYQMAGQEYSLLLASQRPESFARDDIELHQEVEATQSFRSLVDLDGVHQDLVRIEYKKRYEKVLSLDERDVNIKFHELYVEWNPETLAAIQKAMRMSRHEKDYFVDLPRNLKENDIEICDTDDFDGAYYQCESSDDSTAFFDTIDTIDSVDDSLSSFKQQNESFIFQDASSTELKQQSVLFFTPMVMRAIEARSNGKQIWDSEFWANSEVEADVESNCDTDEIESITSIYFDLSKLRVHFNKETRLRRLITAEMNKTSIHHKMNSNGGSSTVAQVGNLTLTDPSYINGNTLYGEILGLKSDICGTASLLKIQFDTFCREKDSTTKSPQRRSKAKQDVLKPVQVNVEEGVVYGCDSFISLHFSPMRFVLLEQLWLEIIDYFYDGIMGYEVWGGMPPDITGQNQEMDMLIDLLCKKLDDNINKSELIGADACGIRFRLFHVIMDSPTIILPVGYRSPHHLSFDMDKITVSTHYSSKVEKCCNKKCENIRYKQWYNNCKIQFSNFRISSWCGAALNINKDPNQTTSDSEFDNHHSSIPLDIDIIWPVGPYAPLVIPKWNVHFQMTTLRLLLRRSDYTLFHHILWNNIGEESRHLDEWNALQTLPLDQLNEYKNRIMVHFGYDKKDAPPTTYKITIGIESIRLHFCSDDLEPIIDIVCHDLKWSLEKKRDKISRQKLLCKSIQLGHTAKSETSPRYRKLLTPLESHDSQEIDGEILSCDIDTVVEGNPQLIYTSTTRSSGDNVKYLEVNDACILFIYPTWIHIKNFFTDLPDPTMMKRQDILNSVQIGNRWYPINKIDARDDLEVSDCLNKKASEETIGSNATIKSSPEYQLRIKLVGPRIILPGSPLTPVGAEINTNKAITLKLSHLDFLRKIDIDGCNSKSLFVHDLELFTGQADDAFHRENKTRGEHSLIYPLCFGAGSVYRSCDQNVYQCNNWVVADVISVRAAFTDMTLAMDVLQNTLSDYRQVSSNIRKVYKDKEKGAIIERSIDKQESLNIAFGGFDLLVIDDSGRHFANAQKLVQISFFGIKYNHGYKLNWKNLDSVLLNDDLEAMARLQVKGFEVIDCIQPKQSPFRTVAATKESPTDTNQSRRWEFMNQTLFQDFMCWQHYSMCNDDWGFITAPKMIERIKFVNDPNWQSKRSSNFIDIHRSTYRGLRDNVSLKISEFVVQWNPSMAIALQRFLGRLKKQISTRTFVQEQSDVDKKSLDAVKRFIRAEFEIKALTICLNKEHQQRRLLQVTLSDTAIVFERDHLYRLNFHGFISDINAWDCDGNQKGQMAMKDSNRLVLCVLRESLVDTNSKSFSTNESNESEEDDDMKEQRFMSFEYFCQPSSEKSVGFKDQNLPSWVTKLVGMDITSSDIDDCLSLTVATLRFNYLSDRTGEIIDYLSNGLPGKGMGATSRAAKGFIQRRIRTRSFLSVSLNAPQLFIPRNRGHEEGVILSLGHVNVRSWFDEASLEECESIMCKHLTIQNKFKISKSESDRSEKFWWRILTLSSIELGWRVHVPGRNSASIENPVDLHIHLRKPPSDKNMSLIIRLKLSYIDLVLSYMDYVFVHQVLNENVMKKIDKSRWDKNEKPFKESIDGDTTDNVIRYAQDARFVRYGSSSHRTDLSSINEKGIRNEKNLTLPSEQNDNSYELLDLKFLLDGLTLVLHRDDPIEASASTNTTGYNYDIISLEVDRVDLAFSAHSNGAKSATLKFYQLALFDQGDVGRLAREFLINNNSNAESKKKSPSAFSVIAEGYDSLNQDDENAVIDENGRVIREPQVILTVDSKPTENVDFGELIEQCDDTTITMACIRMNYMNINPMIRPLKDIADFVLCKWSLEKDDVLFATEEANNLPIDKQPEYTLDSQKRSRIVRGFQLRIVAHYPRVFLLANESDPSTRALVLRGLAIVTTSIIREKTNSETDNGETHTTIDGQFHSLESYINPLPRQVLENINIIDRSNSKDLDVLGVALIEPLSAVFNFHQLKRKYVPLSRKMHVNMQAVSTTLSFEDIRLIEAVVSRWKVASEHEASGNEHKENKSQSNFDDFSFPYSLDENSLDWVDENPDLPTATSPRVEETNTTDVHDSSPCCGDYITYQKQDECKFTSDKKPYYIAFGQEYDVLFQSQMLGLVLRKAGNTVLVDKILEQECSLPIESGDEVVSIAGKRVANMSLQAVVSMLAQSSRPLTITFCRVDEHNSKSLHEIENQDSHCFDKEDCDESDDDIKSTQYLSSKLEETNNIPLMDPHSEHMQSFTIKVKSGEPHGIMIERSVCGGAVTVADVNQDILQSVLIENKSSSLPMRGMLLIAINGDALYKIGFQRSKELLELISLSNHDRHYTLTFLEVASEDWGPVDKVDIVISSMSFSIIDDIAGRDMPLLRGSLQSVAARFERGLGLECTGIKVEPPPFLVFDPSFDGKVGQSDLSDVILKFYANAETKLDYYNARIASWEPLLEPSSLNIAIEYQRGKQTRPGSLSLALSDHQVVNGTDNVQRSLGCANITDAAADVLISAFYEWKQWRKRIRSGIHINTKSTIDLLEGQSTDVDSQNILDVTDGAPQMLLNEDDLPSTINIIDMKTEAVQDAAQAALIYATRRGIESQTDSAKPFVLRNKTGMDISFVSQIQKNFSENLNKIDSISETTFDLQRFISSSITKIEDGEEACFSLDTVRADEFTPNSDNIVDHDSNRIRTYDGRFPNLSVMLQYPGENSRVEIAQDLSVVKIGKKLRRLKVQKVTSNKIITGYINVVWSVELEQNRRIITMSSAVTLTSSKCSIPIEVGIKLSSTNAKNESEQNETKSIGFSTPDSSFFIPLWIDVCFRRAEIFVRPKSVDKSYNWSSQSILQFEGADLSDQSSNGYKWLSSNAHGSVTCDARKNQNNIDNSPAWLSFECDQGKSHSTGKIKKSTSQQEDDHNGFQLISISIFSSLSIRNILPEGIHWEVSNCDPSRKESDRKIIDGSLIRQRFNGEDKDISTFEINSGDRIEVLACNISTMNVQAKFRCGSYHKWSDSVDINDKTSFEMQKYLEDGKQLIEDKNVLHQVFKPRHFNVQLQNKFGAPLTIGLKIIPKVFSRHGESDVVKGFDLVIHSELWLCNFTSLPISFGAPSEQVFSKTKDKSLSRSSNQTVKSSILNAENALLELSSILEFGDKGHSFIGDSDDQSNLGEIISIPSQKNDELVEEVFEYVELENEAIKRRWWASEKHQSERPSPSTLESIGKDEWIWIDPQWKIDIAGDCTAATGGWESCQNLVGGKSKYFSKTRKFDPYHRFRRRRWYRTRKRQTITKTEGNMASNRSDQINRDRPIAFHQPVIDVITRDQKNVKRMQTNGKQGNLINRDSKRFLDVATDIVNEDCLKIHFKVLDGTWSSPAIIPSNGPGHGIIKVHSSRWPEISKLSSEKRPQKSANILSNSLAAGTDGPSKVQFSNGSLGTRCYELSYQISVLEGSWGEFSRLLLLYPRFILRNDSHKWALDVKQVGSADSTLIHVRCRSSVPFYWADPNLPELICVRPVRIDSRGESIHYYNWSGGFDMFNLGIIPLRVREDEMLLKSIKLRDHSFIKVIRALTEIRSGTGGTGITVSFREESPDGSDSLYRIENHSPFPLWIAQDGLLVNPHYHKGRLFAENGRFIGDSECNGDMISPDENVSFGLDVPFRQGKYSGRKAAGLEELLTVRVALAPLSTRDGIETMKVVGLSFIGSNFRLKPSYLRYFSKEDSQSTMSNISVQGIVCADGPTRVLKFNLIQRHLSPGKILRNSVRMHATTQNQASKNHDELSLEQKLLEAANKVNILMAQGKVPKASDLNLIDDIQRFKHFNETAYEQDSPLNCKYSVTAFFSGFVISFIDSVPSEIAVVSVKKLDCIAQWDRNRESDATAAISIGWLQIDNHCPNAPFPVAFTPLITQDVDETPIDSQGDQYAFLSVGIVLAPHHKSNIMCLKGLTISPSDVAVSTDLAFIMRLQHFILSIQHYFDRCQDGDRIKASRNDNVSMSWEFPDLKKHYKRKISTFASDTASSKLYFEALSIQPFNIKLSVAPAVALTNAQAMLEGPDAAAIHAAVRKGDLLIGDDVNGVLGVKIGSKNRTALAVIQGIFKSILVDSLLRLDGASMNLSGIRLNNYIATTMQLKTYVGHHYLSLLKSNVPALLGSLAAFGNPVGLIRGFGDGVSDFVNEPIKGIKKSVVELDPTYAMTGVARGTGSLARHTVGGIVDSASLLTETFSKNMAVLTLDRKYAQRRDQFKILPGTSTTFVQGVESGMNKLFRGVAEGVIGVVRAPVQGAEKRGVEGFAKGVGKGLLGLVVKPVIGLSDAATDFMVGVKGTLDGAGNMRGNSKPTQIRPRRAFYGRDRSLRPYEIVDAISAAIMMRTRIAGENYLSHVDLGGRVAILGVKRFLLLGDNGETELLIKLRNIKVVELRQVPRPNESGRMDWAVLIFLKNNRHGNDIEVITTDDREVALDLCNKIKQGVSISAQR